MTEPVARAKLIGPFLDKIEEWVQRSKGKVRADKVHQRLAAMGFGGNEGTTRRAVAAAKARCRTAHARAYRPRVAEPGLARLYGSVTQAESCQSRSELMREPPACREG